MNYVEGAGWIIHVLLVEDNLGDIRLTQEAFGRVNKSVHVNVARDGIEGMAFLRREGVHVDAPRPDLILLDLNLPRMDGREVLANINEDDALKLIPIAVLTTSDSEEDIAKCYELNASCYLKKPVQFDAFEDLVKSINDFWLTRVILPQQKLAAGLTFHRKPSPA
jgi:two-component system, chemotaxis family, response regulator Rcp1